MNVGSGEVLPGQLRRRNAAPASGLPWYGLAIVTFFFVAQRLPDLFTDFAIYLALLGCVLRPQALTFPMPLR